LKCTELQYELNEIKDIDKKLGKTQTGKTSKTGCCSCILVRTWKYLEHLYYRKKQIV